VFYARTDGPVTVYRDYDVCSLTARDDWASVLHIASEFGFDSIRRLAIRNLFPLASPVDKIVFGHRYGISEWLLDAYVAVCTRLESITDEEGEALGIKDVVRISAIRENIVRGVAVTPSRLRLTLWRSCCPRVVDDIVETVRKDEENRKESPINEAKLHIEEKRATIDRLGKEIKQAQAALLESKSELEHLKAEERQRKRAEEEAQREQWRAEQALAALNVAEKLAREEEQLITAAREAGNVLQAARLELKRAERLDAEARRAAEEREAKPAEIQGLKEQSSDDDWFGWPPKAKAAKTGRPVSPPAPVDTTAEHSQ
jgi:hypothetical protein